MDQIRIQQAEGRLQQYRTGKQALDQRIIENDQWWRLRHWDAIGRRDDPNTPAPASAWLFNAVANKHGDAMDNYPEPVVLPREQSDERDAQILSEILPVIIERCGFEATWSDAMWDKLKSGTAAYCVSWDGGAENGLGDVRIGRASLLNLFWQPGVRDIQDSPDLFYTALVDRSALDAQYPDRAGQLGAPVQGAQYIHDDTIDVSDKALVTDWYYKVQQGARTVVHYCKYCGNTVLYASEDDPACQDGYYTHGQYPFVLDVMFPIEDSPAGFGYVDIMKSPQIYIDKLDSVILTNAVLSGKPRWFLRDAAGVNQDEFADWGQDFVHVTGRITDEDLRQIDVRSLPSFIVNHQQNKIAELKETSGNRDFAQGGTTSGVTAAAAIAALQEAGNKLSRDMLKGSYRAYRSVCALVIELIRQFYTAEREFRIVGQAGRTDFVRYSNAGLADQPLPPAYPGQELEPDYRQAMRRPVFDLVIKAQKSNPYSQLSQNETAKELYQLGVFQPGNADQALALLDMMEFEGVDQVRTRVERNGTLYGQVMQLTGIVQKMAAIMQAHGIDLTGLAAGMGQEADAAAAQGAGGSTMGRRAKQAAMRTREGYGERLARNARASVEADG